jgi:hypothetical protein
MSGDEAAAKEAALAEFRKTLLEHTEVSAKLKQRKRGEFKSVLSRHTHKKKKKKSFVKTLL